MRILREARAQAPVDIAPTRRTARGLDVLNGVRSVPRHVDSVEKLLDHIALFAKVPVVYNGRALREDVPKHIFLSPSILRSFRCVDGCTACCLSFTLDYLPREFSFYSTLWEEGVTQMAQEKFEKREVEVNGLKGYVMSYPQYKDPACPFLRPTRQGGALGCGFWHVGNATQPLECASAPQLMFTTRGLENTVLLKRPFGRAWAWKDKPQCEFSPILDHPGQVDPAYHCDNERMLLQRYREWANYFQIPHHFDVVIDAMTHLAQTIHEGGVRLVQVV
jgi:hypothetical protein